MGFRKIITEKKWNQLMFSVHWMRSNVSRVKLLLKDLESFAQQSVIFSMGLGKDITSDSRDKIITTTMVQTFGEYCQKRNGTLNWLRGYWVSKQFHSNLDVPDLLVMVIHNLRHALSNSIWVLKITTMQVQSKSKKLQKKNSFKNVPEHFLKPGFNLSYSASVN